MPLRPDGARRSAPHQDRGRPAAAGPAPGIEAAASRSPPEGGQDSGRRGRAVVGPAVVGPAGGDPDSGLRRMAVDDRTAVDGPTDPGGHPPERRSGAAGVRRRGRRDPPAEGPTDAVRMAVTRADAGNGPPSVVARVADRRRPGAAPTSTAASIRHRALPARAARRVAGDRRPDRRCGDRTRERVSARDLAVRRAVVHRAEVRPDEGHRVAARRRLGAGRSASFDRPAVGQPRVGCGIRRQR